MTVNEFLFCFFRWRKGLNHHRITMARAINSNWGWLSAGAIGLYVTVGLLTTDVYMLLLREMLRPDFKHCITFSSSL
jgi:hypothetical protein